MIRRPLSPQTIVSYRKILTRAFGTYAPPFGKFQQDLLTWPESMRSQLRAAISRTMKDLGHDPAPLLRVIPTVWVARSAVQVPTEKETLAYEKAAMRLPQGRRALALLPLYMGFRAEELLSLTRPKVIRAVKAGEVMIMRKGGKEQALPCEHVIELFAELLATPAALPKANRIEARDTPLSKRIAWGTVGQILSASKPLTQYHLLHKLIAATGRVADIQGMRPHLLRHSFASRMDRDGATLSTIQSWLGHTSVATTQRYVHPDLIAGKRFVRSVQT